MADVTLPIVFRIHPAIEAIIADLHGNQSENFLSLRQRLFLKILEFYPKDKNGYLYPWSEQASAVREALESAVKLAKIRIQTGVRVFGTYQRKWFQISFSKDGKKGMISGEAVILATGSKAAAS